ncbi:MAG: glutamate-1-semialdehyde 2,1-aminomutase, partial [Bdellovibrionota bacterium]
FIQEAHGAFLKDVDGNQYIDYCMSWGPLILGHQDEEVAEAVKSAISRGWTFGTAEPYSLELAEFMTGAMPWLEKVRFVNSGTEAVMAALRLARAATGRHKVLKFDGCYHGHVDSMLVRAGSGLAEMASPDSAGVSKEVAAETVVSPLDDLEAVKNIFETRGKEIAAVIVEPIPANNGLLIPKEKFLAELCELARKHGALVIFDEVITGFRVAFGGMAEKTGLKPDLVTYGKIIGGGFPVGAYGGRKDLMDLVAPQGAVYQAGTLSANPVSMSAGLATLKKLKRLMPYDDLANRTELLARGIEERAKKAGISIHVQRSASLFWVVLGKINTKDQVVRAAPDTPSEQKEMYARLFHGLLERGVYLAPSGYEVSFMSLAHNNAEIDRTLLAVEDCLKV